jgi:hypothetical protein
MFAEMTRRTRMKIGSAMSHTPELVARSQATVLHRNLTDNDLRRR